MKNNDKDNKHKKVHFILGLLRISIGWIFFWAFIDKLLCLGFPSEGGKCWIDGGSPTAGFLQNGTSGPFASLFQAMADNGFVDGLFMLGLLGIGLALILGIGVKIAGYSGAILMILMWLAVLPKENNPFLDEHIIYLLLLKIFILTNSGEYIGLGKWWGSLELVKKYPILK
ncbi:MAG: hypothetical protein Q8P90_03905 [bacterium]|nr:hypothetical protein [bacterium]